MPVITFLEEYDFKGKTIIPFASHEGSGLGSGSSVSKSKSNIENWVDGLSLDIQK